MSTDYDRIERAIAFIRQNKEQQPDLKQVAAHVGLSPSHFQRLFQRWAGVTLKRFLEFLTVEHAKTLLQASKSVMETSLETGLSGSGRLHDQFISIEAVSPGEFKSRGAGLNIRYGFRATPYGEALLGISSRGIIALSFIDNEERQKVLEKLQSDWCNASFVEDNKSTKSILNSLFTQEKITKEKNLLSVRGTNFQIKVWNALLGIPDGCVVSYQSIADKIERPGSVRAVANAIGANPVAYLIPCHRVLRSNGELSGYRWGADRKRIMLGKEWAEDSSA
jgi:AraC family transcriptional regulator, regulatory protein of adaptative response / methylated-DNA-[protein]-cysteine methyltransferase